MCHWCPLLLTGGRLRLAGAAGLLLFLTTCMHDMPAERIHAAHAGPVIPTKLWNRSRMYSSVMDSTGRWVYSVGPKAVRATVWDTANASRVMDVPMGWPAFAPDSRGLYVYDVEAREVTYWMLGKSDDPTIIPCPPSVVLDALMPNAATDRWCFFRGDDTAILLLDRETGRFRTLIDVARHRALRRLCVPGAYPVTLDYLEGRLVFGRYHLTAFRADLESGEARYLPSFRVHPNFVQVVTLPGKAPTLYYATRDCFLALSTDDFLHPKPTPYAPPSLDSLEFYVISPAVDRLVYISLRGLGEPCEMHVHRLSDGERLIAGLPCATGHIRQVWPSTDGQRWLLWDENGETSLWEWNERLPGR
jgi:hypothetical protein